MTNDELINLAVLTEQIKDDLEEINEIISQYINVESKPVKKKKNWKELSMSEILIKFGITPNLNGFRYILDAVTMFKVEDIRKTLQCDAGEKEVFVLMGIDRDRRSSISPYKSFASTETSRNSSPVINVFGIR